MKTIQNIRIGTQQGFFAALEDGIEIGFGDKNALKFKTVHYNKSKAGEERQVFTAQQKKVYNAIKKVLQSKLNKGETLKEALAQITKAQYGLWERLLVRYLKNEIPHTRIIRVKDLLQPERKAYEALKAMAGKIINEDN